MVDLWRKRRTAVLRVSAHEITTSISFLEGVPVWAIGGAKSETLGQLCVRHGLLDEEQYEKAILRFAELDDQGASVRLGDVLIELGFLDSGQLQRALRTQVREKIIACFQWPEVEIEIGLDSGEIRKGNRSPWPVPALIAEGVVRYFDDRRCESVIGPHLGRHVQLFDSPGTVAALLNVPLELVQPFGVERRLHEIIGAEAQLSRQLAAAMMLLGFFDVIGTQDIADQLHLPATMDLSFGDGVEEPEDTDPDLMSKLEEEHQKLLSVAPEIYFGIRPNASPKEVEVAFQTRVRPFVQAALKGSSAKEQARLTEIYNAIAAAKDSLLEKPAQVSIKIARIKPATELDAEAAFLRGKQMLERGERKAAADMFAQACEKDPSARVYQMYRAYNDMLRAQTDWDRDKAFAETKKYAKETLEQDAKNGKAHLMLGRLLKLEGKEDRARQEFEKAVEVANDKEAELELRVLQRRQAKKEKEKTKGGGLFFWKKL
jgi:tetratricopeptide (TPR) repeat protein